MVKKGSKHGLNTGNTIRQHQRTSALRHHQKYSCLLVSSNIAENLLAARNAIGDVNAVIPHECCDGLELSLNKRGRWQLPDYLKTKIENEQDNCDVQMTVMEHTLMPSADTLNGEWRTCESYYSNTGNVRQSVSDREMTVTSAKQGHRAEDHLSKLERRQLKRARNENIVTDVSYTEDDCDLPYLECHVIYGAPNNGKLYKNIATKGFAKSSKKSKNVTSGCSKMHLSKSQHLYEDDELCLYSDEEVEGAEISENTTSEPMTASLADLLVSSTNQRKRTVRKCSGASTDSGISSLSNFSCHSKDKIVYLDEPVFPRRQRSARSRHITPPFSPALPQYSNILVRNSDVDMASLVLNFGDKYRESYCTPRTFTLDFSNDLGAKASNERLYMVMVLRAEGKEYDQYRVYCTGTCIDKKSTRIPTVEEGAVYDLVSLKALVLAHAGVAPTEKRSSSSRSTLVKCVEATKRRQNSFVSARWNVSSSELSELTELTVSNHHKQIAANISNYKRTVEDLVYIPTQLQRSMSCAIQCGICFEELNNNMLHSALLSCQHYFCNECWTVHVSNAVREGLVHITCPEYECKKETDSVFLMSMLEFSTYSLHEVHMTEYSLFSQKKAIWCPSEGCRRLLHCDDDLAERDEPITANCKCGCQCCFKCRGEPHWPLSCEELKRYHDCLRKNGFKELVDAESVLSITVLTRPCPKCREPIEKNGGCPSMRCVLCRSGFCWSCGHLFGNGYHYCNTEYKSELIEIVYELKRVNNQDLMETCKHRLYKSKGTRTHLKKLCTQLLMNTGVKHKLVIQSVGKSQSLRRFLNQIVRQILATHNLLDYCCAVNMFRKGYKCCAPAISSLSYSVGVLERELASPRCNQQTVDKMTKYYDIVKSNTRLLIQQMSGVLSFVTPKVGNDKS